MRTLLTLLLGSLAGLVGMGVAGCGPNSKEDDEPPPVVLVDTDRDGISDRDEGAAALVDTDRDGTPDFRDRDSDGDTLPDADEAGDHDVSTPPFDSDQDQRPDFRDLDSDGNERDDEVEGLEDRDRDGLGNFADPDDDGDGISDLDELGPNPSVGVDTDNDGTPDLHDLDSDGDTIADVFETGADYDHDGLANFRDLDADGDCRGDRQEAGPGPTPRDTDADRRYDFLDRDSDNDGVADRVEDANCDGGHAAPESDALRGDSDGDGVTDLIEREAGTDPNDAADNPRARGDFVFVMPYQQPQLPVSDNLDFKPALKSVDLYVIVDRSVSMAAETQAIKDQLDGVIHSLQCAPLGTGLPGECIPDLHAGLGGIGYRTQQPFKHYLPIQPSPNFAGTAVPNVGGSDTVEAMIFGLWTAITNLGSADPPARSCGLAQVLPNPSCPPGHFGQACFRPGALPVMVLATDEPALHESDTSACPGWENETRARLAARKAKLVGVYGSAPLGLTVSDLITLATDTGAVDASAGGAPLVFDGADSGAATAIGNGIRSLVRGVPLDMGVTAVDHPGDAVNAVAAFVDYLETRQVGDARCAAGLTDRDSNQDGRKDEFLGVRAGTPLCWKLSTRPNLTVPQLEEPQLFRARIDVVGDGITVVDSRDVFFLVPPRVLDEPIE
jgi:hypothetical protein